MFSFMRLPVALPTTALLLLAGSAYGQSTTKPPSNSAAHGKTLFLTVGCAECHGTMAQGGVGPHLVPNPLPAMAIAGYIRNPPGVMPPYAASVLSDSDVADIASYLASIPASPSASQISELK